MKKRSSIHANWACIFRKVCKENQGERIPTWRIHLRKSLVHKVKGQTLCWTGWRAAPQWCCCFLFLLFDFSPCFKQCSPFPAALWSEVGSIPSVYKSQRDVTPSAHPLPPPSIHSFLQPSDVTLASQGEGFLRQGLGDVVVSSHECTQFVYLSARDVMQRWSRRRGPASAVSIISFCFFGNYVYFWMMWLRNESQCHHITLVQSSFILALNEIQIWFSTPEILNTGLNFVSSKLDHDEQIFWCYR